MLKSERRLEILRLLEEKSVISVPDLSARFGVSESTIRRDLQNLAQQGLLQRTYGGAMSAEEERAWDALEARNDPFLEMKRRIGRAAARLINPGDTICLQAGSTTLQVARHLRGKQNLTVITNDIYVGRELARHPGITVHLSGGTLRKDSRVLVGPLAEQTMSQFHVDKAFLGITAISLPRD
jgi:DeoR/GlpR family transcriptional regulator of sugar metabolism